MSHVVIKFNIDNAYFKTESGDDDAYMIGNGNVVGHFETVGD